MSQVVETDSSRPRGSSPADSGVEQADAGRSSPGVPAVLAAACSTPGSHHAGRSARVQSRRTRSTQMQAQGGRTRSHRLPTFWRLIPLILITFTLAPVQASADGVFNLYGGYFAVRPADSRDVDDVIYNNAGFLAFEVDDFNGGTFGAEYHVGAGRYFEVGGGVGYYQRDVTSVYWDYVNDNGCGDRAGDEPEDGADHAHGQGVPVRAAPGRRALRGRRRLVRELEVQRGGRVHRLQQRQRGVPRPVRRRRLGNAAGAAGGSAGSRSATCSGSAASSAGRPARRISTSRRGSRAARSTSAATPTSRRSASGSEPRLLRCQASG